MRRLVAATTVFTFILLSCIAGCRSLGETEARAVFAEAEERINMSYAAVADAATSGANVSALLLVLDSAGSFLSKAELALACREYDAAYALAVDCKAELEGIEDEAASLKEQGLQAGYLDLMFNVVASATGSLAIAFGGVFLYVFLTRKPKKEQLSDGAK